MKIEHPISFANTKDTAPCVDWVSKAKNLLKHLLCDSSQTSVSQTFVTFRIAEFCEIYAQVELSTNTPIVPQSYLYDYDSAVTLTLSAHWQVGDPTCATQYHLSSVEECKDKLGSVLNNCDTDGVEKKYGGSNIVDCIDWTMTVSTSQTSQPDISVCEKR